MQKITYLVYLCDIFLVGSTNHGQCGANESIIKFSYYRG